MTVRTRFAPSPTGYLHIGGVRTALFNWLFARRHGGQFILRIDNTDQERNRPEALQPILDGFQWLGIHWDEGPNVGGAYGPYFQAERNHLYVAAALKLLEAGKAYPCYATKEQLDADRKSAEAQKKSYVHRGQHRNTPAAENVKLYEAQPTTIRLKVPDGQTVVVDDQICGKVEVRTDLISDPVILRSDGSALYNFATVIDDEAMKITHIIRAKEHLSNTPVQVLVYQALGVTPPIFAHVPVVNAPKSNKKLSKRDMAKFMTPDVVTTLRTVGAVASDWTDEQIRGNENLNPATVAYYRAMGYLPESLVNYFGRLGWSLDDKTEIMSLETMIGHFGFDRINDSSASFDPEKLYWMAGEYFHQAPLARRVEMVLPILRRCNLVGETLEGATQAKLEKVVEACAERLKIATDILAYGAFFFRDPIYDPQAVKKRLHKDGAMELMTAAVEPLNSLPESFEAGTVEALLKGWCEARGAKFGDLTNALRVALTGIQVGPHLFDCVAILGKRECLRRIETATKLPKS